MSKTGLTNSAEIRTTIYEADCEYGEAYIGETQQELKTRMKERRRHTKRRDTEISGIADHFLEKYPIYLGEARIIMKNQNWYKR